MFGIRLGEFGKGFVGGLAESANEALKTDIKNINTRIDDLAKIKFDRALKDQDERKKEVTEAEEILREAGAVFGDDPYAADYAAALLKETGSIDAFRQEIAKLRTAKDNNVPLAQFIRRASVDSPTGTFRDYANAYVNSRRTMPDLTTPVDTTSTGDLVGSILGKDIDIGGRVDKRVSEQMSAAGVTPVTDAGAFTAPSLSYDREGLSMYQMSPAERVTYLRQEMARTQNTDARNDELRGMLSDNLQAAIKEGDLETQLSGLKTQLSYATTDSDRERLQGEVLAVTREMQMNAAVTPKAKLAVTISHAEEDSDGSAEALANITKLRDKFEDMTSPLTLSTQIARAERDLKARVAAGEDIPDYQEQLKKLQDQRDKLDEIGGTDLLSVDDTGPMETRISGSIQGLLRVSPLASKFETELAPDGVTRKLVIPPGLEEAREQELRDELTSITQRVFDQYASMDMRTKERMAFEFVRDLYGMEISEKTADPSGKDQEPPAITEPLVIGDTTVAADALSALAAANDLDLAAITDGVRNTVTTYPPTDIASAAKFAGDAGDNLEEELDDLKMMGVYSDEWLAAARAASSGDADTVVVDENVTKAADAIAGSSAGNYFKISSIMEATGLSRKKAALLLPQANDELERRKTSELLSADVEDLSVRELLKRVESATTNDEYEKALAVYMERSGRTDEDNIRRMRPPPVQTKAKGGLMARGA